MLFSRDDSLKCYAIMFKQKTCIFDCLHLDVVLGKGENEFKIREARLGSMLSVVSALFLHGWVFLEVY